MDTTLGPLPTPEDLGFGVLFDRILDAIVVGDVVTGRVVLMNSAARLLFGYGDQETRGMPIEALVADSMRQRHRDGLAAYAATRQGALIDSGCPRQVTAVRRDGTDVPIELTLSPLPGPGEDGRYLMALARDASAHERLAAEQRALLGAARDYARRQEELASMQATFTAMVAHELGTPVAAIRGLVDLLISGTLPPDSQAPLLAAMRAETDLIQRLIADVQTASAIERDDFSVLRRPMAVPALIADAMAFARTLARTHPVSELVDDLALTAVVLADPERIGQVVRNLLTNAARHTPPGTAITLRALGGQDGVRIEIADRGPGIPPSDRARIFEKFGRGQEALNRQTPGVGLGLYLSQRIILGHGGVLAVTSSPGQETVFAFTLERV